MVWKDHESPSVQLETVRLSGISARSLVETLVQMVLKHIEDILKLREGNEYMKYRLDSIVISGPAPSVHSIRPTCYTQWSSTSANGVLLLKTQSLQFVSPASASAGSGTVPYKEAVHAGLQHKNSGLILMASLQSVTRKSQHQDLHHLTQRNVVDNRL